MRIHAGGLTVICCTILAASTASADPLIISEFRVRGPSGANDEFVEIYNNSGSVHTVAASSGTGYGLFASDGALRGTIPDGTVIPAGGHFLFTNTAFSLGSYPANAGTIVGGDAIYTLDIADNAGIALFTTNLPIDAMLAQRMDAVGSTSEANALYKEGTGYPALTPFSIDYSFYRKFPNVGVIAVADGCIATTPADPVDTNNNASDFLFVDTNGTSAGAGQRLGAPGPQSSSSPRAAGTGATGLAVTLLDPTVGVSSAPNYVRDQTSSPANNSTFGTIELRRVFTNLTGASISRLRFRFIHLNTFPSPTGIADLRPRTSADVSVTVNSVPVTVRGTKLEQPPSQPNGGGFNSSMSVETVVLATPLANNASVAFSLFLGVQQTGAFRVFVEAETEARDVGTIFGFLGNEAMTLITDCAVVDTSTVVTSSVNPSQFGEEVVFTATLTPAGTGTVIFKAGASTLGTVPVTAGKASLNVSNLAVSTSFITAVYGGDANHLTSTSEILEQVVTKADTTTTLTASPNPSGRFVTVTLKATVASATPSGATGTVEFKDGDTSLGSATISAGVATLSIDSLALGSHTLTAAYAGDDQHKASPADPITHVVEKAKPTVTLASSKNPSTLGQQVTFTASLSSAVATGTVTFFNGTTSLGVVNVVAGEASVDVSNLSLGVSSISATYSGDADHDGKASDPLTQTVNKLPTATTLVASANPTPFGTAFTLTATVSAGGTGTVEFFDGVTLLGSDSVSGGEASFTIDDAAAGSHSFRAAYQGDATHQASNSVALAHTVTKLASATGVSASANPATAGQPVTLTATVTPVGASGQVVWKDGATVLATLALTDGKAILMTTALAAGAHTITATYSGDGNHDGSTSAVLNLVVDKAATTTSLVSVPNVSFFGEPVTFTAVVSSTAATGSVTFTDGATVVGTATLTGGMAMITLTALDAGPHSIIATYAGDGTFAGSDSDFLMYIVSRAVTTTTITSSPNPAGVGVGITVMVTVTADGGIPTGGVRLFDGNTEIASGDLEAGGVVTLTVASLGAGTHVLHVDYEGDINFANGISSVVSQVVLGPPTPDAGTIDAATVPADAAPPTPDAGGAADARTADAGTAAADARLGADAAPTMVTESADGCSCTTAGRRPAAPTTLLLFGLVALIRRATRRPAPGGRGGRDPR